MHWSTRALLSAFAGWLSAILIFPLLQLVDVFLVRLNNRTYLAFWAMGGVLWFVTYVLTAFAYGRMLDRSDETRCRNCDYILRGLRDPRCPECGERI